MFFYHLRNIAKVQPFLSQADTGRLMHAFITSRLDHCSALFSSLPKKTINKLQIIQNAAALVLSNTKKRAHLETHVLKSLHWLPVSFRIDLKMLLLVLKSLNGQVPENLPDMLLMCSSIETTQVFWHWPFSLYLWCGQRNACRRHLMSLVLASGNTGAGAVAICYHLNHQEI